MINLKLNTNASRSEFIYELYLYSNPIFLVLLDSEIININIQNLNKESNYKFTTRRYGPDKDEYYMDITYNDHFFQYNFENSNKEDFLITLQTFSKSNGFLIKQTQAHADVFESGRKDGSNYIRLIFDNMIIDDLSRLPNEFIPAIISYNQERSKYLRDKKINEILGL